jgi:molecular chaperone GrpE
MIRPHKPEHEAPADASAPPPEDAVARLERELKDAKDQCLRTLAELDNARKRHQREKEEYGKYAAETLVRELLPIIDSLDHALVAVDKQAEPQAVIKGIHLIYRQLLGLLGKEGVKRIETVGAPFDPHRHEAVGHVDAIDGQPENTVAEEVQVGYTMHGKVIRPAVVKVARKAAVSNQPSASSEGHTKESQAS